MLARALKMALWVCYDHLGKLVLANLICAAAVLTPGFLSMAAFAAGGALIPLLAGFALAGITLFVSIPLSLAGLAHFAKVLVDERDASLRDFALGVRRFGRRAVALGFLYGAAVCCFATSAWFYSELMKTTLPWLGFALSAVALWCLAFLAFMSVLTPPALVQKDGGVVQTARLAAVLALDNPVFALGLAVQLVALLLLSVLMAPLAVFLSGAAAVVLLTTAYEQLARKYALAELRKAATHVPEEGLPLEGFGPGIRVISRRGKLEVDDREDDYLNRGLRDFLFPWKG